MTPSISDYAYSYVKQFGFHLVPLPPKAKKPIANDWGLTAINDPNAARDYYQQHANDNIGVALGPSRLCSFDVDDLEATRTIFEEFGWDLDQLISAHPTIQGQPPGVRVMFSVPEGAALPYHNLTWPSANDPTGDKHRELMKQALAARDAGDLQTEANLRDEAKAFARFTVFEIRSGQDGQRQDVLPPSIHPDTNQPYTWITKPTATGFPPPPEFLLSLWANWDALKPQLQDVCPWKPSQCTPRPAPSPRQATGQPSVIDAYNTATSITQALASYGYRQQGKRWLSPHSSTGLPGVNIFPAPDNRCWIHHASDPLCSNENNQPVGPFDLFCWYEHGGDTVKAVKAAADALGMNHRPAPQRAPQPQPTIDQETGEILDDQSTPANDNAASFGQPVDVFGIAPPPALPMDVLPDALVPYIKDQAELTGSDPGIIALSALVSAAACISDGIKLQPKRHDPTWTESARLWVAFVGDPSTKKSPAISKAVRHVKRIDHRMAEENATKASEHAWQHEQWKEAKKADKQNPPPEPKPPAIQRLVVEDITVEALTEVLKDNPRGVLTLKDELTGWFASMDAYKSGAKGASMDRAHWLEAYNGGRRVIDRITRGNVIVPNWSTCIIGGVQPDMIRRVANGMGNDGLLQRFMVFCARPAVLDADKAPDMTAMANYGELFDQLVKLQPCDTPVMLSEAAHQSRERVASYAKRMIEAMDHPHIQAWLGKWDGLYARLLLLYHVIEMATRREFPTNTKVTGATAAKVERLMLGILLHHAIHFYTEVLDANDRQEHTRQLARLILAKGWQKVTRRELAIQWRASRKMEWWEMRGVIEHLVVLGWLDPEPGAIDTDGRPRSWFVNPAVHSMFADYATKERDRRKQVQQTIFEMKQAYS